MLVHPQGVHLSQQGRKVPQVAPVDHGIHPREHPRGNTVPNGLHGRIEGPRMVPEGVMGFPQAIQAHQNMPHPGLLQAVNGGRVEEHAVGLDLHGQAHILQEGQDLETFGIEQRLPAGDVDLLDVQGPQTG